MHKILLILIFSLFSLLFCNSGDFIIINKPVETRTTQQLESGYYLIRSIYCDVYVLALTPKQLNSYIKKNNITYAKTSNHEEALKNNVFFAIKLKNTYADPIIISRIYTSYNKHTYDSLVSQDLDENNFYKKISAYRRIISSDYYRENPFPDESIPYYLNFIAPGDTAITIVAFPGKACANPLYSLNLDLDIMEIKRSISFDIKRSKYRITGKYFRQNGNLYEN